MYRRPCCCNLLALLLCSLVIPNPSSGLATEEELPPSSSQDALGLIASLQHPHEDSSNELRRLANMYEFLQMAAIQQHQRERFPEVEEREREEREEYPPLALPLQSQIAALQDKDEYLKDKRGSYMSLCHFKICNMGRKRSYFNTWGRN